MTKFLRSTLHGSMVCLALATTSAQALDSNLKMTGVLVSEPCTLDPNAPSLTVDFKSVIDAWLYQYSRTEPTSFTIELKDCDISLSKAAMLTFRGTESKALPGLIVATGTGGNGIGIGIEQPDGTSLPFNKATPAYELESGDNKIQLQAFVQAEDGVIKNQSLTPGEFSAAATFEVAYP